jgi:uncharacterized protein (TIGR02996 family)
MNQEQAFLQAICEDPDDDTPRLIYADWLDEHGQPERAEFIRVQCELARLPRWHRRWQHCLAHQRHLIVGDARGLPPLPAGLSWGQFGRGFVESVRTSDLPTFVKFAPVIFADAPVQHLVVEVAAREVSLVPLAESPWLARLHGVEKTGFGSRLGAGEVEQLGNSPHAGALRSLRFRCGGLLEEGVSALVETAVFPRLTALDLGESGGWVTLTQTVVDALAGVSAPVPLSALQLSSTRLAVADVEVLAASRVMVNLTELDLYDNPVWAGGCGALARSPGLGRLQVLRLGKTAPGLAGVEALAASPHLTDLRWLDLRNNGLDSAAGRVLAGAANLSRLTVLELRNNPIGDRGVCELTASPHLASLVKLDLAGCKIGDRGGRALLAWPALADVVYLDLGRNAFSASVREGLRERFGDRVAL